MFVSTIPDQDCRNELARLRYGRLACARDDQPYVVPITFAYADGYLYGYSTPGQKIEWMRTNPLVCVQADEINFMHDWMSIVVYAVYEELTHEDNDVECRRAEALLDRHALWWEPAHISALFRGEDAEVKPIFFRLRIVEVTGRRVRPSELSV